MKNATVRFICNGYTVELFGDPEVPPPGFQTFFAATVAEVVYFLSQFFEGVALGKAPAPRAFSKASERALKAVDPLMNQETRIFPTTAPGYIVRQMPLATVPARPVLDEWCPNMDAVAIELDEIYSDGSILPPQPQGLFRFVLIVQPTGVSGSIEVTEGPAAFVETYRVIVATVDGVNTYDVQTATGWTAHDLANAIAGAVNGDGAGFCWAQLNTGSLTLTPRTAPNTIVSLSAGLFNGAQQLARVPRQAEPADVGEPA